jgi:hypothetical protein
MKITISILLLLLGHSVEASTATASWDRSPDPTVTGYNLYQGGASHSYTNFVDVGTNTAFVISNLVSGRTYYFAVTAHAAWLESDFSAEVSYTAPFQLPTITQQPVSATNNTGGAQVFTVQASSAGQTLTYQWLKNSTNLVNGANISGATNNTLTVSALTYRDAGNYQCRVTDLAGPILTAIASLSVRPPAPTVVITGSQ